jgi:cytochrome b subunit of formate dehydrogenase
MTCLLVGTLTLSLLHTLAWLIRLWLTRKQWRRHKERGEEVLVRRFSRLQRTMHLFMLLSFFTLALTGMALKFSYMEWAQLLSRLLGGFYAAAILHRIGAIILIAVFLVHLWDVWRKKRESKLSWWRYLTAPNSMLFNLTDLRELWQSLKWFAGFGERPRYGRFTYWEKFDYFAVFWGVFVIGSTGLILWFPEFFTRLIPGWSVNVATIIHSDEALLAVAFIFTIHFFNTHFRPDKFPMDTVIFTGRVSLDEVEYDRPREHEEMVAAGQAKDQQIEPMPKGTERAFKFFGFLFLAIGLTMIALIVYSMLFHYR